jgi:hypothetical protein
MVTMRINRLARVTIGHPSQREAALAEAAARREAVTS